MSQYVPGKWDGYGIGEEALEAILAGHHGSSADAPDLLVTVDCGTTATTELADVTDRGVDVVVTDHHDPEDELPAVTACVNPRRSTSEYPHDALAGGAVAYKLGEALLADETASLPEFRRYGLPLASVATLGDYVPLNLENRAIARSGFERLPETDLPGLRAVADHQNVTDIRDIPWSLVPYLNAAQEDEDGHLLVELLLAEDDDRISGYLATLSAYRESRRDDRADQREHLDACYQAQYPDGPGEDRLVAIETDEYVSGGLVSQLSAELGRPVITYREKDGYYQGAGRTDQDVNLLELYEDCADRLSEYWGHPGAAGFELDRADRDTFVREIRRAIRRRYSPETLRPTLEIDAVLDQDRVDRELVDQVHRLGPFGTDNPEPLVQVESIHVERIEPFGEDDQHRRLAPADADLSLVDWDGTAGTETISAGEAYTVVGTLGWNDYEDQPQVSLSACRPATARD